MERSTPAVAAVAPVPMESVLEKVVSAAETVGRVMPQQETGPFLAVAAAVVPIRPVRTILLVGMVIRESSSFEITGR